MYLGLRLPEVHFASWQECSWSVTIKETDCVQGGRGMSATLTNEAAKLIGRLGFVLDGEYAIHKKMDVTLQIEELAAITSLAELDDRLKSALRGS